MNVLQDVMTQSEIEFMSFRNNTSPSETQEEQT